MALEDVDPPEEPRDEAFGPGLGRAIRVIRAGLDLSRKELAERTGLSRSYVAEIENGKKTPSSRALAALATALGVEPRGLLEAAERWESEPPPHSYETLRDATSGAGATPIQPTLPRGELSSRLPRASSRRELMRFLSRGPGADERIEGAPEKGRGARGAAYADEGDSGALRDAREVLELFARLDAEDRERVLDLARRLAGA